MDRKGHIVVYVADEADFASARLIFQRRQAGNRLGIAARDRAAAGVVLVKRAQFTFQQLSDWRDSVYVHLLGTGGVLSDDVDEAINRVTIGIDRQRFQQQREELLPRLRVLGIPIEAVHFEPTGRVAPKLAPMSAFFAPDSLVSLADTLGAGYLIGPYGCSIGIVADSGSVRVFITASHCSSSVYHRDSTLYSQPAGSRYVGFETADPLTNSTYCDFINGGYHCYDGRGSDANVVRIAPGVPSRRGVIARTQNRMYGTSGTLGIDQSNRWIHVTSTEYGHPVGTTVDKVGRTSGWTYGYIENSCIDRIADGPGLNPDYAVRCSVRTSTYSLGGDSGSPFFVWDGYQTAKFMGILWGGEVGNDNVTYYAGYRALEADLGILDAGVLKVTSDLTLEPVVLTASFDGQGGTILSWSGAGNGYGTVYTLSRTDYYIEYDREWGWPYYVQGWSGQIYQSPYAESYRDTWISGTQVVSCPADPYTFSNYSEYMVAATSMGMTVTSTVCVLQ